jgi:hypothetical protein
MIRTDAAVTELSLRALIVIHAHGSRGVAAVSYIPARSMCWSRARWRRSCPSSPPDLWIASTPAGSHDPPLTLARAGRCALDTTMCHTGKSQSSYCVATQAVVVGSECCWQRPDHVLAGRALGPRYRVGDEGHHAGPRAVSVRQHRTVGLAAVSAGVDDLPTMATAPV